MSMSPVVVLGPGTVSDDVSKSSVKRVYKLCHHECTHLSLLYRSVGYGPLFHLT